MDYDSSGHLLEVVKESLDCPSKRVSIALTKALREIECLSNEDRPKYRVTEAAIRLELMASPDDVANGMATPVVAV